MDVGGQVGQGVHHFEGPALVQRLREWARALGFSQIGIADIDLAAEEPGLQAWLDAGFHGSMAYMARHGLKRARPAALVPGTVRVISARMDYLPRDTPPTWVADETAALHDPQRAVVSRASVCAVSERPSRPIPTMTWRSSRSLSPAAGQPRLRMSNPCS